MAYTEKDPDRWATELGHRIHGCENCQPYEDGIVWSDDPMSVTAFLEENGVPNDLHELVTERLCCNCGSDLDLSTEIVADPFEVQLDELAGDRFGEWAVEDNPRLNEFVNILMTSPTTASSHEIGVQILKDLRELPTCNVAGNWWRARSLPKNECPPSTEMLGPPPRPSRGGGRFNRPGQRAFYLATERSSAIAEAQKYQKTGDETWVLKYQIDNIARIGNLAAPGTRSHVFRDLSIPTLFAGVMWCDGLIQQDCGTIKPAYALAQFIADSAISIGIKGLQVNSQLHDGTNLILFAWDDGVAKAIGVPEFCETDR